MDSLSFKSWSISWYYFIMIICQHSYVFVRWYTSFFPLFTLFMLLYFVLNWTDIIVNELIKEMFTSWICVMAVFLPSSPLIAHIYILKTHSVVFIFIHIISYSPQFVFSCETIIVLVFILHRHKKGFL